MNEGMKQRMHAPPVDVFFEILHRMLELAKFYASFLQASCPLQLPKITGMLWVLCTAGNCRSELGNAITLFLVLLAPTAVLMWRALPQPQLVQNRIVNTLLATWVQNTLGSMVGSLAIVVIVAIVTVFVVLLLVIQKLSDKSWRHQGIFPELQNFQELEFPARDRV